MEARTLTDEETATLKKKAREILSVCRRDILSKYPFIGSIALRMDMIPVRDLRVRTACTDGDSVYFDIAFLSSLTREEQTFVLAHEVWHAVLMHLVRRHDRNPQLFNVATDKEVNYMLKQDGLVPPADLCFPEGDEVGKCAEEIYEMLLKKMPKQKRNSGNNSSNSNGNSQNNSQSSSSQNSKPRNKSGQNNSPSNGNGQKNGQDDGTLTGQFDKHIYEGDEPQQQPNGNNSPADGNGQQNDGNPADGNGQPNSFEVSDKYGKVGFDSDFKPRVAKNFSDKMRETIISEAQRVEKIKGNLPAHIKSLVTKIMEPEVKWQEVLAQFVTKCYNGGTRTWIPPNRRHVHNDLYLQSRQADRIKLAVGIDTSGSTMSDRSKFLGELHSLIKSFGIFDLHIIECDAEVGAYKHYTQDDDLEFEIDNGEYAMSGGGGTAMLPIYNYILDNQIECDAICIMTDGYIDNIPTNPIPSIPTLWIITKDGTEDFCDWGQKIHLKESGYDEQQYNINVNNVCSIDRENRLNILK